MISYGDRALIMRGNGRSSERDPPIRQAVGLRAANDPAIRPPSQKGFKMPPPPGTIIGKTCEGQDVTWAKVEAAAKDVREWLDLKMTSGSYSTGLVHQLAAHYCRIPQVFGNRILLVDVHAVFNQIGELEKATLTRVVRTKPAELFTVGPLKGLWHKHWFQASFLVTNLLNETQKHGEMLIRKHLNAEFGRDRWIGETMTEKFAGRLVHALVNGGLSHRSGSAARKPSRLTGEWIIFAKTRGRNIYLTLAGHDETNEAVLSRCALALKEFPELASLEPFVAGQ